MEGIEYRRGEAHILKGISWRVAAGDLGVYNPMLENHPCFGERADFRFRT